MELREIKTLLEANTKVLATQIEMSRELFFVKITELKEDTQEIKQHIKETNGQVKNNSTSILLLKEKQCQESKRRKRVWAASFAAVTAMFAAMLTYVVHKFS